MDKQLRTLLRDLTQKIMWESIGTEGTEIWVCKSCFRESYTKSNWYHPIKPNGRWHNPQCLALRAFNYLVRHGERPAIVDIREKETHNAVD